MSDPTLTDEQRWEAVVRRDSSFDGTFVMAVRTTGVYCRPSCPSRRPRRRNVGFFPVPEAAETAGFRPCLRCRPRDAISEDPRLDLVRRLCRAIHASPTRIPRLNELAALEGVSPGHVQRTFKRLVGISPKDYAEARRLRTLKKSLRTRRSVTVAQYAAGLGSSSRLYERAPTHLGMTPAAYRDGGKGAEIAFGFAPCSLGQLLVAATERGVCAVKIGDRRRTLEAELRAEFPEARVHRDDDKLAGCLGEVVAIAEGKEGRADLPVDVRATAFQWKVWQLLRRIPRGRTMTYGDLARAVGIPGAARAVGRACGANPIALVIPCHRVVRGDGGMGGYRWGLERKARLLDTERTRTDGAPGGDAFTSEHLE